MSWRVATCVAGLLAATAASAEVAPTPQTRAALRDLVEFARIPNVTTRDPAEIRHAGAWLATLLQRHGWTVRTLPDGDTPMLFAEAGEAKPGARTILFYAHMDGQPVRISEWAQPDAFAPVLRACADTRTCATLPLDRLESGALDPDWRLFARAVADDKAPILMLMAAVDTLRAQHRAPGVAIKLILDSHEEGGPPTLKDVVAANAELLRADALVILDGPMHPSNRPTLILGHRGGGVIRLTVFGPRIAAHSGHYGNYVPNPAQRLAQLVAGFKDADGRVLIPGYDDGIDPAFTAAATGASVPDDEAAMRRHFGIASIDRVGATYRAAMAKPSLNIVGLGAGSMGAIDQTIVPADAVAAFDIRTVPGVDFAREAGLVRAAVERAGYHLVDGAPTDEERARYPLLARFESRWLSDPLFTDPHAPVATWVRGALGRDGVVIPIMGGSVPTAPLVQGLKVPAVILPLVNADDNQHAANENLRIGNFVGGVDTLVRLLSAR